jgi:hypothetical protein
MDVDKTVFGKKEALQLKGIAIMLMLFHHLFRSVGLFDGYTISFFPFEKTNI